VKQYTISLLSIFALASCLSIMYLFQSQTLSASWISDSVTVDLRAGPPNHYYRLDIGWSGANYTSGFYSCLH
jgi:hypothetical protein